MRALHPPPRACEGDGAIQEVAPEVGGFQGERAYDSSQLLEKINRQIGCATKLYLEETANLLSNISGAMTRMNTLLGGLLCDWKTLVNSQSSCLVHFE